MTDDTFEELAEMTEGLNELDACDSLKAFGVDYISWEGIEDEVKVQLLFEDDDAAQRFADQLDEPDEFEEDDRCQHEYRLYLSGDDLDRNASRFVPGWQRPY